jgi:hypothetical protein
MMDGTDPEMITGEVVARRAARNAKARMTAGHAIPWWLWVFPAGTWVMAGYLPIAAAVAGTLTFAVACWLMYSINRRFDALVQLLDDSRTSE